MVAGGHCTENALQSPPSDPQLCPNSLCAGLRVTLLLSWEIAGKVWQHQELSQILIGIETRK